MAGYLGAIPVPQATQNRESFTASADQTSFATAGYTVGFVDAFLNGVRLNTADFTATNGSDIVLASGAAENDVLDVISYATFEVNAQTFTGTTTLTDVVAASLDISGAVDIAGTTNLDVVDIDGTVNIAAATTIATNNKIQFRDTAIHISSPADGDLAIAADDEIDITSTLIDINGNLDVSGTALVTGILTTTAEVVLNGGAQINAAVNVGVNDQGYDFKFFGDTASRYMRWDSSSDSLLFTDDSKIQMGNGSDFLIYHDPNVNIIEAATSNQDIIFKGNDGGSPVDALRLDMSQLGEADFNNAIKVAGGIAAHQTNRGVFSFGSNSLLIRSYGASAGDGKIEFKVAGGGGSEDFLALTIEADKDVRIADGDLVIGTSGHGINFQAFGGGTNIDNNLLNDYEEGTWSPTLNGLTFASIASANYTKIGNRVLFDCQVVMPVTSATQVMQILTLPFSTSSSDGGGSLGYTTSGSSKLEGAIGLLLQGSTVSFYVDGGPGSFTQADFSNAQIRISGQYQTNS